uniref:Uncharacterized protein n=1 Tax=Anguilla anguilla TaxID=7936 RepID=A0A0E9R294_ANGAN
MFPGGREEFLPYSLFSTVDTPRLGIDNVDQGIFIVFHIHHSHVIVLTPALGQK